MAKITDLPVTVALTGAEMLPIVQLGSTKRATLASFRDLIVPFLQYWYKGEQGDTGPANNTYRTIAALAASPISQRSATLAPDEDSGLTGATYTWKAGDYRGRNDVIASDAVPVSQGAWVLPDGRGLLSKLKAAGSVFLTQEEINAERISVKRFGAKGDGTADDIAAIQRAIDWAWTAGGGTIELPTGVYKITSSIKLRGNVTLVGHGPFSRVIANGCDAISVLASDEIGPRRICNLWLQGHGSDAFAAINTEVDFPARVQGLVIENVYLSFFGVGVRAKGLWHATIRTATINQVHKGFVFYGRNVKVAIDDCRVTNGGAVTGDGPSMGIQVGNDEPGFRPEEIHVTKTLFYNFARGAYWRNCLFGSLTYCGLDYCTESAIHFVTADGGTTFSHNWGQIDNDGAMVRGVYGEALGTTPAIDNIEIANNRLRATTVQTKPGEIRSVGVDIGNRQANIRLTGNSMQGAFQVGMRLDGAERTHARENTADAGLIQFNCRGGSIKDNHFDGGMTLSNNVGVSYGGNSGLHTTEIIGSVDIPAGQTSVTITYLSLNKPDLPQGGILVSCTAADRGFVGHAWVAFAPTRTGLTVTVPAALGALSTIDFHLRIYS